MRLITAILALAACGGGAGGDGPGDGDGDGGPPGADAATQPDPDPSAKIFDESAIRTFELTIAQSDLDFLNDNALLEQYVPARLDYDGETVENIGVRYKGAFGSLVLCFDEEGNLVCDKLSMKLKFSEYDPEQKFRGLKRINLHSMNGDPSKMHDAISYKLFRDANVYASRTAYARLVVNGELLGLFLAVEAVDGRFARARFPDGGEGNVYKEVWPVHNSSQPYLGALKTNRDESPSVDKMIRFAADIAGSNDTTFPTVMESWTDVGMLMRYMAVARLLDHWDGIVAFYCGSGGGCGNHNYYWYESRDEDKVWLIPWDLDHTFEEPSPVRTFFGMPDWDVVDASCELIPIFSSSLGKAPACDPVVGGMARTLYDPYKDESAALLAGDFSSASLGARIDELAALIAVAIEEDPDVTSNEWNSGVNQLRSAADAKRSHVQAKLP